VTPEADLPVPLDNDPLFPHKRPNRALAGSVAAVAVVGAVVLFKYAVDVLAIALVLGATIVLVCRLASWLLRRPLIRLGSVVILLVIVAAIGWPLRSLVPSVSPVAVFERSLHFERFLPKRVVGFLEWSERHGWAQRFPFPLESGEGENSGWTGSEKSTLMITASQTVVRLGQPVTLAAMLRFASAPVSGAPTSIQFLDGRARLAAVQSQMLDDRAS
jgi:hypothetical protein